TRDGVTPASRRRPMHAPREPRKPGRGGAAGRAGDPGKAVHVGVAANDGGQGRDGAAVALADRRHRALVVHAVGIREEIDRAAETVLEPTLTLLDLRHHVD